MSQSILNTQVSLEKMGAGRTLIHTTTTAKIPRRTLVSVGLALLLVAGIFVELVFDKPSHVIGLMAGLCIFLVLVFVLAKAVAKALSGVWEVDTNTHTLKRLDGFSKQSWSEISLPPTGRVILRSLRILRERASGGAGSDPIKTIHRLTIQGGAAPSPGVLSEALIAQGKEDQSKTHSALGELPILHDSQLLMALGNGILPFRLGIAVARTTGFDLADLAVDPPVCLSNEALDNESSKAWLPWVDVNLPQTFYRISGIRPSEIKGVAGKNGTLSFGPGHRGRNIVLALIVTVFFATMVAVTHSVSVGIFGALIVAVLVGQKTVCTINGKGIRWRHTLLGLPMDEAVGVSWSKLILVRLKSRPGLVLDFATDAAYYSLTLPPGDTGAWLVGAVAVELAKYQELGN